MALWARLLKQAALSATRGWLLYKVLLDVPEVIFIRDWEKKEGRGE